MFCPLIPVQPCLQSVSCVQEQFGSSFTVAYAEVGCRLSSTTVGASRLFTIQASVIGHLESCATEACVLFGEPCLVAFCFLDNVASRISQSTSSNCSSVHFHSFIRKSFAFSLPTSNLIVLLRSPVSFLPW